MQMFNRSSFRLDEQTDMGREPSDQTFVADPFSYNFPVYRENRFR